VDGFYNGKAVCEVKTDFLKILFTSLSDRDIAQAVSRWFSTAMAWVRSKSCHMGFVVDEVKYICFEV
jgi:hypothetical protein